MVLGWFSSGVQRDMMVIRQEDESEDDGSCSDYSGHDSNGSAGSFEGQEIGRPTPVRLAVSAATAATVAGVVLVVVVYFGLHGGARHDTAGMDISARLRGMEMVLVKGSEDDEGEKKLDLESAPVTDLRASVEAPAAGGVQDDGTCGHIKCSPNASCVNGICGMPGATRCGELVCGEGATCCSNNRICCEAGSVCGGEPGEEVCLAPEPAPGPAAHPAPTVGNDKRCGAIYCAPGASCVDGVCGVPRGTQCNKELCGEGAICCGSSCCAPEAGCAGEKGEEVCASPPPYDGIIALPAPKVGASRRCGEIQCASEEDTCVNGICGAPDATQCGHRLLCGKDAMCCGSICCMKGGRCGGMKEAPICVSS